MKVILESERLRLCEFDASDLGPLAAMVADEEQMSFYPRPKTSEEASEWIDRNRRLYREFGFGFWCLRVRATSAFAGYCGIRPLALDGASEIEIGWHTKKAFWRQGIATEAASAAQELAFRCFRLSRLVAVIHPDHIASRRVAEKIGMRAEKSLVIEDDYPAVIYASGVEKVARTVP